MDRYEVSVGRFRKFVAAYEVSLLPDDNAGSVYGAPNTGWSKAWNNNRSLLPPERDSIQYSLRNCGTQGSAWDSSDHDELPVRCVTWYLAQAFCIWDGGRLPTEAEWTFAAMGGDFERNYPWSTSQNDSSISADLAVYWDSDHTREAPEPVGSRLDAAGRFGQTDLAGNVSEWVLDWYRDALPNLCPGSVNNTDCVDVEPTCCRGRRGGSYVDAPDSLRNTYRSWGDPTDLSPVNGFRCVHESS